MTLQIRDALLTDITPKGRHPHVKVYRERALARHYKPESSRNRTQENRRRMLAAGKAEK